MCEIEYCEKQALQTLTINTDGQFLAMKFCPLHAVRLEEKLCEMTGKEIDLAGLYVGTAGQLTEAIEYLNALSAAKYEQGN